MAKTVTEVRSDIGAIDYAVTYAMRQGGFPMRPIWTGTISFGLVNIPVSLIGAEETKELSFSLMDSKDHAKIRYQRINADTGKEVAWDQIVKYYEFPDGSYVTVTDEDFAKADPKSSKAVEIEAFIDATELSPLYMEKPYFIKPNKGGDKAYALLRAAMAETGQVGIGKVTIRTRQSLCAIMPQEEGLVLLMLRFASELRSIEALNLPDTVKKARITKKELDLAVSLIKNLSVAWNPEDYKDEYSEALMARIEAKSRAKGKPLPDEPEVDRKPSKVVDLMALLKQSVEAKNAATVQSKAKTSERRPKKKTS